MLIARASGSESTCGSILKALDIMIMDAVAVVDAGILDAVDAAEVVGAVKGSLGIWGRGVGRL